MCLICFTFRALLVLVNNLRVSLLAPVGLACCRKKRPGDFGADLASSVFYIVLDEPSVLWSNLLRG